jgi:hypothetical protein
MADIETQNCGSRPMPEFVRKGVVRVSSGNLYLKAAYRVLWLREEHPDWSIHTAIEYADWQQGFVVVKAVIMDAEGKVIATAHAEESRGRLPFVRKAETGAIARALGLCGYGTEFGELDEEETEAQVAPREGKAAGNGKQAVNTGDTQCSVCHAPAGKLHAKGCTAA